MRLSEHKQRLFWNERVADLTHAMLSYRQHPLSHPLTQDIHARIGTKDNICTNSLVFFVLPHVYGAFLC